MVDEQNYEFSEQALGAMAEYINLRRKQSHFANARSIRNAIDRIRLRQANRLFQANAGPVGRKDLITLEEGDVRASRVFTGGLDSDAKPILPSAED